MKFNWFAIDKEGLSKQAAALGKGRLVGELIQNALDEDGVTKIEVEVTPITGTRSVLVEVKDDSPEGFRDLAHSYTLFAESYKKEDPTKRGQFNIGEKLVLSLCKDASIHTTKGTVLFKEDGSREVSKSKTEVGTLFRGTVRATVKETEQITEYVKTLLLPSTPEVCFNGKKLDPRPAIRSFSESIETVLSDEEGIMRPTTRKTTISVYKVAEGETAMLYEMGLPIVETGDKWHINVQQKVPLNRDRDNVKPAYLRKLRTIVLNNTTDLITEEDANSPWIRQASEDKDCSKDAMEKVLDYRFGTKRAIFDPSDLEANKRFISEGGRIIYPSMMSKSEWQNVKQNDLASPAGRLCPSPKPYSDDPNASPADIIAPEKWTDDMKRVVSYSNFLATELLGHTISVSIVKTFNNFGAAYGAGNLDFNLQRLGHRWFQKDNWQEIDRLIIHEFGHEYSMDHLSSKYHDALCELGAKLKRLALQKPEDLTRYMTEDVA